MKASTFLDERRLLNGPWQAFERDVARALIFSGFEDVRLVGGSGDRGADIIGVKRGQVWVVQCKYTSQSGPPKEAVKEVADAGRFYGADRMVVATSRIPGPRFNEEVDRYTGVGIHIEVLTPSKLIELMSAVGEYAPARRILRDYQRESSNLLREALIDVGRGQLVLATGLGKTVVMAETVSDLFRDGLIPHDRVLVLADKRELVKQLQLGFWNQLPKWVPTHLLSGSEEPVFWDGITFATVQSVVSRLNSLPEFGLILVDEAHHIGSSTFRHAIESLNAPMLGGVTATPWRGDGFDIDGLLGKALVQIGIAEGLSRKFLSEVDYRLLADNLDWGLVQEKSFYNYSLTQLNKKLLIPTRDEEAARHIADVFYREKRCGGIVFSPTIEHAQHFSEMLRRFGLRAEPISSAQDERERDKLLASFRKGQIDIMSSVDLFNEGVDVPDVDLIVFMRATHSRRIFVQQIGRGLRISAQKDKVIVLDFVTDLRRIAEVLELEKAARGPLEKLPLGRQLIRFHDASAGAFMLEWMKDQADLMLREGDPMLKLPAFDYPETPLPGGVE
jgi:superfamily II DNA or RNA helicase